MTRSTTQSGGAVTLSDIDYTTIAAPEVDEAAVDETITTPEQVFNCEQGDVLWIAGTEYVVVDESFTILGKNPLIVVSKDGAHGKLAAGMTDDSAGGVAWVETLANCERGGVRKTHLLGEFGDIYKLKSNGLEMLHSYLPNTDTRSCPSCTHDGTGQPIRIEEQGTQTIEIKRCLNTDCSQPFRFVRETPEPDHATVLTYDGETDTLTPLTITGRFRCERQDDFKFPVDTNTAREEGIYSAQEVADFINPKMVGDRYGWVTIKDDNRWGQDRLHIQWKNAKGYAADMRITFKRVNAKPETYWEAIHRVSGLALADLFK
jgi:hypothetical protein